jgi:predicted  nucleic acid-binding Zn-ribbon protein
VSQAVTLQSALAEAHEDALLLRGQVASQQHHINLLGGNLQGRLSLVQGSVLADMQQQATQKDTALAASAQQVLAVQSELEKLSCSYAAKLVAEQAERQRLSAEAAQARLLCTARGRQVATLQQELQGMRDAATQQQQTAAASSGIQQQQLESLQERLQDMQQQLAAAHQEAADAQHVAAAAEGGRNGLRQQLEGLQALLADKQLQVEWLEGKVADLEGSNISQQVCVLLCRDCCLVMVWCHVLSGVMLGVPVVVPCAVCACCLMVIS